MRRTTATEGGRPVRSEVSAPARRTITPATLLLAMEQVARDRQTTCSLLADAQFLPSTTQRR